MLGIAEVTSVENVGGTRQVGGTCVDVSVLSLLLTVIFIVSPPRHPQLLQGHQGCLGFKTRRRAEEIQDAIITQCDKVYDQQVHLLLIRDREAERLRLNQDAVFKLHNTPVPRSDSLTIQ